MCPGPCYVQPVTLTLNIFLSNCEIISRYKERVRTKYIKSLKPTDTSAFLQGKNWTFMRDGLDDFRDGLPPSHDNEDIFLRVSSHIIT